MMRDYLSPAKKVIERVLPSPGAARSFLAKHHIFLSIATTSVVVSMTLGFIVLRMTGAAVDSARQSVTTETKTSVLTTSTTPDVTASQPATIVNQQTTSQSSPSSDTTAETHTSVTVNNQPVDVPVNGTTHKTVTNSDGSMTDVTVTNNSQSNSSGSSSTSVTTNTNTNSTQTSHSFSNNMSIERSSQ